MEEEIALELIQRFRRDRRVLLSFILSGSLIKKVVMPPGAVSLDDVDLDQVSIDYVLNCAKKGEILELSEAIRDYHDSLALPLTTNAGFIEEFFLVTNPEASGSPPTRPPPPIPVSTPIVTSLSKSQSLHSGQFQELTVDDIDDFDDEEVESPRTARPLPNEAVDLVLGFPPFATGLSDDDLRETAYEILLASAGVVGGLIVPVKEKKKDKKSRLMRKLARSKSDNVVPPSQRTTGLTGLLETMRVQLEISEAMDVRTRQALLHALVGKEGKRMDTLLVPLEMLSCVSRTEFSDRKAYIRWQKRQLNVLEEGLLNYPIVRFGELRQKANELRVLLRKIEESEALPHSTGEIQRTDCLRSLREIATALAERPARGDLTGLVCHWADGYFLNVKLYEKLLSSVFDVLDEGKLTEEVEEILEFLKSTWRILGITETIHLTCYAWVLFRQIVITGEQGLLRCATEQLRKIPLKEQLGAQERSHLKSLRCSVEGEEGSQDFTFMESFLLPILKWADRQLRDYHLHFAERLTTMEGILTIGLHTRRIIQEEPGLVTQIKVVSDHEQIESYVSSSIKHAFARTLQEVEDEADIEPQHILATLAEECKKLLKKDSTMFMPIMCQWNAHAKVVSASILHKLYGIKLKPFLERAHHLTEDVVQVLPVADSLEQYVMAVIASVCDEENLDDHYREKIIPYQVENVSGTLVLRWVNSQHGRIMEWVERTIQQERWDPISPQQRHGSSIVEVYRIIEETVDQIFGLKVPMRPGELSSLFRGLDNAFQVYAHHVVEKLISKEDLIPPVPVLTRYRKEHGIKAFVKKEIIEQRLPDERFTQLSGMSTSNLCVRLNTLYYAVSQLNVLEDSIWDRWTKKKAHGNPNMKKVLDNKSRSFGFHQRKEGFENSRKDINAAIDQICDFIGTKIIFWDLREQFIDNLYKPSVSQSRLEMLVDALDMELNQLCDVIVMPLRDRVVTGLLQASLRSLLDGGPSRLFFSSDAKLLEEDLEILKEFFISGGQGLPRGTVENLVARIRPVVTLHGYETHELISDMRCSSVSGNRSSLGDTGILLRILCHRSDS
ncbi:protein unc-13 homolog isoform X2 [Aristolochia californica]|uniref:protein unc-13 homolog isoform X2 n=1 Tax=Aristolochia californica TaxID=171875 RepID=UPI0035D61A47